LLRDRSDYKAAIVLLEQIHATLTLELGPSDPRTLSALRALAICSDELGKAAKARIMHQTCLELRLQALGVEHRDTLQSMCDVADGLVNIAQYARAVEMLESCRERNSTKSYTTTRCPSTWLFWRRASECTAITTRRRTS
jgi:hypothetical protein